MFLNFFLDSFSGKKDDFGVLIIMVDYWAKYGRFMNKYDRFNFLNERIDEIEGGGDSGLGDRVTALETVVGDENSGLVKDVNGIVTLIGDSEEPAEGTILARIIALEQKE